MRIFWAFISLCLLSCTVVRQPAIETTGPRVYLGPTGPLGTGQTICLSPFVAEDDQLGWATAQIYRNALLEAGIPANIRLLSGRPILKGQKVKDCDYILLGKINYLLPPAPTGGGALEIEVEMYSLPHWSPFLHLVESAIIPYGTYGEYPPGIDIRTAPAPSAATVIKRLADHLGQILY
ncbi:hypothetical protein [Thermosulfuriphilus sp.]